MSPKALFFLLFGFLVFFVSDLGAEEYGEIHDPAGGVEVYAGKDLKASVMGRAKNGEVLPFEWDGDWSESNRGQSSILDKWLWTFCGLP